MTTIETKLNELKRDLNYITRTLNNLLSDDYEATDAMRRTVNAMQATILEIELEITPEIATDENLIAA